MIHIILYQSMHTGPRDALPLREIYDEVNFFSPEHPCPTLEETAELKADFRERRTLSDAVFFKLMQQANPYEAENCISWRKAKKPPRLIFAEVTDKNTHKLVRETYPKIRQENIRLGLVDFANRDYEKLKQHFLTALETEVKTTNLRESALYATVKDKSKKYGKLKKQYKWCLALGANHHQPRKALEEIAEKTKGVSFELRTEFPFLTSCWEVACSEIQRNPFYDFSQRAFEDLVLASVCNFFMETGTDERVKYEFASSYKIATASETDRQSFIEQIQEGGPKLVSPLREEAHIYIPKIKSIVEDSGFLPTLKETAEIFKEAYPKNELQKNWNYV